MAPSCSICYLLPAVFTFSIASLPFYNNAQSPSPPSPPSPSPSPIAKLSTSWVNNPSIYINSTVFRRSNLTPVLQTPPSNASQMMCGFYCLSTQQTQPSSCLFGVAIVQNTSYLYSDIPPIINAPQLVWSANRDRPVQINATLQLTRDGDLRLEDADGTFVWSTNTSAKSVFGMKVTELGNLVLFDRNNATVWQSFDHPTDSLLVGQTLFLDQKLTSSTSSSNWTRGSYSLTVQDDNFLVAYIESSPPLPYFKSFLDVNYVKFESESFLGQKIPVASSSSPQFIRLDPDGHLKAYEWDRENWNVVADLMTSDIGNCGYPMACGNYGICSSNGQCSCLEEANSTFRQINYRQPSLGCSLVTPISCDHSQNHTILELKNTSYFYYNSHDYLSSIYWDEKLALDDCKTSCLNNCSCTAALFQDGCLLLSDIFSLISNEGTTYQNVAVFLKVHKSLTTQYPIPSPTNPPQKKSGQVKIIMGSSLGAFFGVFFVVASCIFLFKKKQESGDFDEFSVDQVPGTSTRFSYEELRAMTNNFNDKLGEGGFGSVFQGTLNDGTKVAVKRLNGFGQVKKSYLAEVETIGSIHHVNLDQSQVVTMMRGTPGYLAPEWLRSIITEKVDVYSFGVVVLEMLCGRKNLDRSQPEEDMHLLDLFKRKAEEERLLDIVDKYNDDMQTHRAEVVEMMRVAVWCLQSDFSRRPSMSVVVKVLEGSVDVQSNLDYSFTTPVATGAITVAGHQEDHIGAATPLFASTLSGPR
ncbi:hypothetical protein HYC85_014276 [Camellia sinensis]|uniref:Receptor-like serine/threonine-protein kinase n=1 Tax=Camellia sinensis TaxID=4442 RepID=A0A7J7H613_CAMSI|nr:hypothetical protein HYC85_014276 [Camellia sinensis]